MVPDDPRPQRLQVKKLIATVFNYSLDGLLADPDTEFWKFCFGLPENNAPDDPAQLDFLRSADAHVMGRTAYEGIAPSMKTSTDHPFAPILNAAHKVVFSRTLRRPTGPTRPSPLVTRRRRSASSGKAATATSWSGAASASGVRSCSST